MVVLTGNVKRTQRDYSLAFKLQVIDEIEKGLLTYKQSQKKYGIQGRSTVLMWLRKHGRLNWQKGESMGKKPAPNKKINELEKKIKRLEAEKEVLNIAIDVADEMLGTEIRKKYLALSLERYKRQSEDKQQ
jgi:transposase